MNFRRPLILASSSPRRQYLLKEIGLSFSIEKPVVEEDFPNEMPVDEVSRYLALKKAEYFRLRIHDEVVVTADTVVIISNRILNKPESRSHAIEMLSELAGNTHKVMTGVSIVSKEKEESFDETTFVTFKKATREEIETYVDSFKPFDKAGSYGAQDCLPPGINPCSKEEMDFLRRIDKLSLIESTFTKDETGKGLTLISKIDGSYFNVMGLPIHKVCDHLFRF